MNQTRPRPPALWGVVLLVLASSAGLLSLLLLLAQTATQAATPTSGLRLNEILAGTNGDSQIQFIEIEVQDLGQKCWGPQHLGSSCYAGVEENVGRLMLLFFDGAGVQTGRWVFPSDPGGPFKTVLIATQGFADLAGAPTPDFLLPAELMALSGQVCVRGNPANLNAPSLNLCLAYGAFSGAQQPNAAPGDPVAGPFSGPLNGAPVAGLLPILDTVSLNRSANAFGDQLNSDFAQISRPTPRNTANQTIVLPFANQLQQGETLFMKETFSGNGRTCGGCHIPAEAFGLSLATINALPPTDPLFIAEFNLNSLTLSAQAQPSDLRGPLTASDGTTVTVLAETETAYLIYGGNAGLVGQSLTDGWGNSAVVQTFSAGDLNALDNPALMHSRALFVENIDGFASSPNMRTSPHLINMKFSGPPFGWSGNISDLGTFTVGAIRQHAPRTLARVDGVDFRLPTDEELAAMVAFQFSLTNPKNENFNLDLFATTAAQQRGRGIFFSSHSCKDCHFATALSIAQRPSDDGSEHTFNTGVQNQAVNATLPQEPPQAGVQGRFFSMPPLFGIHDSAPFFHEGSAATLTDVVKFYTSTTFINSIAGQDQIPRFDLFTDQDVADIAAFMETLQEKPYEYTGVGGFGTQLVSAGPTPSQAFVITNTGTSNLTVSGLILNSFDGTPSTDYVITGLPPGTPFGPGESRVMAVAFDPASVGIKSANLEFIVTDTSTGESYASGVALDGRGASFGPTIGGIVNQTVDLGTSTGPIAFVISPATGTLTAASSNPGLVPTGNIVFGGSGADRTVAITPVAGLTGTASITLTLSDGVATASESLVLEANGLPSLSGLTDQTTPEDTPLTLPFTVGDNETALTELVLTTASSNTGLVPSSHVVLGGSGGSRTLTIVPLPNLSGAATITVTVYDKVWSVSQALTLTVGAVDDPPELTNLNDQSTNLNTPSDPQVFGLSDVDTNLDSLVLSAASSDPSLVPAGNIVFGGAGGERTVTVTPAADQTGAAVITVTVSDGMSSASSAYILTVSAVPVSTATPTPTRTPTPTAGPSPTATPTATDAEPPRYYLWLPLVGK